MFKAIPFMDMKAIKYFIPLIFSLSMNDDEANFNYDVGSLTDLLQDRKSVLVRLR